MSVVLIHQGMGLFLMPLLWQNFSRILILYIKDIRNYVSGIKFTENVKYGDSLNPSWFSF